MPKPRCSDEEFAKLFRAYGATETAKQLGLNVRSVYDRRSRLEFTLDAPIESPNLVGGVPKNEARYPKRIPETLQDGIMLVGSDAHYWPDLISPAHRGFVSVIRQLQPQIVVLNGDVVDGVKNSRHAPIMWARGPSVSLELETCLERTEEIRSAAPNAKPYWLLGNHDMRFENRLSERVPEYEGVAGLVLSDHFPAWKIGISLWVNDNVVTKHRFKGGVHATHNNTLHAGKTMVTGHLHSLKVTPFDDYNGTRYGIDTGTLADPYGAQFEYGEDNPLNHRSGFIVLTFKNGKLLIPEIAAVVDENHIQFRGEIFSV